MCQLSVATTSSSSTFVLVPCGFQHIICHMDLTTQIIGHEEAMSALVRVYAWIQCSNHHT